MVKKSARFVCSECGAVFPKWAGKCDSCGAWNTIVEDESVEMTALPQATGGKGGRKIEFVGLSGAPEVLWRMKSGIAEFDRVCGGGLVAGSVLLIGGDPGIGKSTLLLQATGALSRVCNIKGEPVRCIYISGEESVGQVRLRAMRMGLADAKVDLASVSNVRDIVATLDSENADVVVIDSIQTMFSDALDSAPGTVGQVRACANELIRLAKKKGFVLFLVGHVTKEGSLAGPRVLEHMVDTVLYFEGDRGHHFRILRSVKNRFGATDEIGVFEMVEKGLEEVPNPSALFLAERRGNIFGSCVFAGVEGTRPMLVEIQALASAMAGTSPRRAVVGWDSSRLSMLLAVLEARCGIAFSTKDVYLNVAGGLRITEPACDLAVACALLSAVSQIPVPADMAVFGEVGLAAEVRAAPQRDLRLKEAAKLGFSRVLLPPQNVNKKSVKKADTGLKLIEIGHLKSLLEMFSLSDSKK